MPKRFVGLFFLSDSELKWTPLAFWLPYAPVYYIWNKLKSTHVKTVVSICHQFYTDDDYVHGEKKKLFVAIGDTCNPRRSNDKRLKTLEDICSTMTSRDSRKNFLPNFASLDLNNVPSTDDGNPTLGQILASINDLKRNAVTTDMLKESLKSFKETLTPSFSVFPSLPEPEAEFA